MTGLTFDEANHIYRWNGELVPSVTMILKTWTRVKIEGREYYVNHAGTVVGAEKFDKAADFGTAIHKGAGYLLTGCDLDWASLHADLRHPLRQFEEWMHHYKVKPILVEKPLYSKKRRFAGTPDIICYIGTKSLPTVVDIKTGDDEIAGPQTAGYAELYKEEFGYRGFVMRFCLKLPKRGPYKVVPLTNKSDLDFFNAKHFEYQHMRNR